MRITFRQLEVFTAIARHGTTTHAAAQISLSQSATSMALAELENLDVISGKPVCIRIIDIPEDKE